MSPDLMATADFYSTPGFILKTFDIPLKTDVIARFAELTEKSGGL